MPDETAQLSELARLHQNGALTDAEFAAAKRRVLGDEATVEAHAPDVAEPRNDSQTPSTAVPRPRPTIPQAPPTAKAPAPRTVADRVYRSLVISGDGVTSQELASRPSLSAEDVGIGLDDLTSSSIVYLDRRSDTYWVAEKAPRPGSTAAPKGVRPAPKPRQGPAANSSLGGWAIAVLFLGFLGGLIGYFATKDENPARANNIMKWGLIWTVLGWLLWTAVVTVLLSA